MEATHTLITDLAIVLVVGAAAAALFRLLRQPSILGYLFAGLIVGPNLPVPIFADPGRVHALSELGVILVMFAVGLEFRVAKLIRVLPVAGVTGLVQVGAMAWAGYTVGHLLGYSQVTALFLGTSLAISSTMVVSRVFGDAPGAEGARDLIFGVLVLQDVAAIGLIAAMTAVAAGGQVSAGELAATLGQLAAVLLGLLGIGMLIVPRMVRRATATGSHELIAVVAGGICFGFALLAEELGYSVALGAFLAGILVSESGHGEQIEHLMAPMKDLFAAVFFVSIGMAIDPRVAWDHVGSSLLVAGVVVVGQLLSVSIAGVLSGNGLSRSVTAGLALGQVGEFSFILAAIGASAGVVDASLQPILVTVAALTTFTTPVALRASERVVRWLDHRLPPRLLRLLSFYEGWLAQVASRDDGRPASPHRRLLTVIAVDGLALTLLGVAALVWGQAIVAAARARLPLPGPLQGAALGAAALAIFLPFMISLANNTRRFATQLALSLGEAGGGTSVARARLTEGLVTLLVIAGVGFPAVAILRPFHEEPWVLPLLLVALLGLGFGLWRRAGEMEQELSSGAERLLELVAEQSAHEAHPAVMASLPGADDVLVLHLPAEAAVDGRSIVELDVRARTGASIVAIYRPSGALTPPRPTERLRSLDILAVVGPPDARDRARALLTDARPSGAAHPPQSGAPDL